VLGEGGMGVVFLAVDQEVRGEMFAIKVLRPEVRANPESLRLLREEVRRTRALRHPNIVGVYSLNSDPSGVYMLMEYLDGKSLKNVLDDEFGRGMPLIRAWPMIYDVGAALAYAHDHNVVHSDIKPSNIIITSSSSCKLLDFGIARADRNRTTTIRDATQIGALTPAYACCEMFEGRAPDQSDDVYAFACVIYEMLTGRHPYGRVNAVDARTRKLQPPPIKLLTNRQNAALARALEFDRERRTASVEILLEGLKGMVNNERDRRAWMTTAGGIAVIGALSTGWFLEHRAAHKDSVAEVSPAAMSPTPAATPAPSAVQATAPAEPMGHAPLKAEHGQPAARPEPGVTTPSASAKGKVATVVADARPASSEPPAMAPTVSGTSGKAAGAPAVTPAPATTATTPGVASSLALSAPTKTTPAATAAPSKAMPETGAPATAAVSTPPKPIPVETLAPVPAVLSALPKTIPETVAPAAASSMPPKANPETGAAAATTAVSTPPKTIAKETVAPAPTSLGAATPVAGSPAHTDTTTLDPIKIRTKVTVPAVAASSTASVSPDATATSPATVVAPLPTLSAAVQSEIDHPPFGKKLPSVVATSDSQAKMEGGESCAYPAEARNEMQTGTVVLLVYVLPDGSAGSAQLDSNGSSGSPVLDQAAVKCVSAVGSFPAKFVGSKPVGYWARTKFVWSFGG
jgi:TonB family protein